MYGFCLFSVSMKITFHKYQGTGNDFVMIDDRARSFPMNSSTLISSLCDRKMGIGADGVILIQDHEKYDFTMIYFNPDGSKSLCGNGSRCAIAFAKSLGIIENRTIFETTDGVHDAFIEGETIHFHLHDVQSVETHGDDWFIDTGSPHHVQVVTDIDAFEVVPKAEPYATANSIAPQAPM